MSSAAGPVRLDRRRRQQGRRCARCRSAAGMGNNVIVTDGLQAGDRYIVEGVLKVFSPACR